VTLQDLKGKTFCSNEESKTLSDYADDIQSDYRFKTCNDTEEILFYEDGVYLQNAEYIIKEECEKRIKDCTSYKASEIVKTIKRRTYCNREEFDNYPFLINLQNGVYDLQSGDFVPHNENNLFRFKIPIDYVPEAKCKNVLQFLKDILPNPSDFVTILEFIASALLRESIRLEKIIMLVGDGANGKSTLLELITRFLGDANVSNTSIHDLIYNRFAKAGLDGKLANIFNDLSDKELAHLGTLKALVSGDKIRAEHKGKNAFEFRSFAKMIFACNQLPDVREDTDAIFRRFIIIEFNQKFLTVPKDEDSDLVKKANPDILAKLTTDEELSGLLNIVLKIGMNLKKIGHYSYEQSTGQIRQGWREKSDTIQAFINTHLKVEQGIAPRSSVYSRYVTYCTTNKIIPKNNTQFNILLKQKLPIEPKDTRINGKSQRVWQGILLKEATQATTLSNY